MAETAGNTTPARRRFHALSERALPYAIAELLEQELAAQPNRDRSRAFVLVIPEIEQGEHFVQDFTFYCRGLLGASAEVRCERFRAWEVLPFDALSPATEVSAERIAALEALRRQPEEGGVLLLVTTARALMQRLLAPNQLSEAAFELKAGTRLSRDELVHRLVECGYSRTSIVEEVGQLAVRGAVVDFYSPAQPLAVRLEYFGDEVESIRSFDPASQRSVERLETVHVLPVSELLLAPSGASSSSLPTLDEAVSRLKQRAAELELPPRKIEPLLEALETRSLTAGIEHLAPLINPRIGTLFDYLPSDASILVYDEAGCARRAEEFDELVTERFASARKEDRLLPVPDEAYVPAGEMLEVLDRCVSVSMEQLDFVSSLGDGSDASSVKAAVSANDDLRRELRAAVRSEQPFASLVETLRRRAARGCAQALVSASAERAERLAEMLRPYGFECTVSGEAFFDWRRRALRHPGVANKLTVLIGAAQFGVFDSRHNVSVITEADIFPHLAQRRARSTAAQSVRRFLGDVSQLSEDDFIVHMDHGIGIYRGLKQLEVGGVLGDFLHLEYADEARLFLPVENIARVQKYVGVEGKTPVLTKLGSKGWERSKAKVKERVAELAGQLINLYAERQLVQGISFGWPNTEDSAFADSFEFTETPDQEKAINDVLADMAREQPMDRLVCGDVGYGKTEVAIRAAFKAVSAGWQVAVLVPTTILADQHYATFSARFADQPFSIAAVSRFISPQENRRTLERLAEGRIDIIIGTHRLLQKDVRFKKLGLVVIDEEHRFGVAHKERLKAFRREVDVLTLTATPIPRTLHMSLLGIRDLSVIETAPSDRHFVRTYLAPYRDEIVREAIMREIGRGGQVFYIHNRVQTIAQVADEVRELVPEAKVEFAHGQMKEKELEAVMHDFVQHKFDVLVSTTIVESGLDIANANTIIVRKADHFGLAELYQLRGRVGRSSRRAYAYLLISDPKTLGSEAKKRLAVLQSLDDLGQGFRLALQDMEIRGAGNLLGKDQSGQVNDVGFDLYSRILREAVANLQAKMSAGDSDETKMPVVEPEITLGFPGFIPTDYVPDVEQRLILYQRLAALETEREGLELAEEIEDRFGRRPAEVDTFIEAMMLRAVARRGAVTSVTYRPPIVTLNFHPDAPIKAESIMRLVGSSRGAVSVTPGMALKIKTEPHEVKSPADITRAVRNVLQALNLSGPASRIVKDLQGAVESP